MNKTLAPLVAFIAVVVVIGLVLHFSGMPEGLTSAVVGGIFGIYPTLAITSAERKKTNQERIAELVKGNIYIHPVLATFYILCYLQFIERTLGFVFGAAIAMALSTSGQAAPAIVTQIVYMISPLFVLLVLIFAIVPIAKYTTHRVKRFPFLWIVLAIVIDQVINLAVVALLLNMTVTMDAVIAQAAFALLLLPGAVIGIVWARKTHLVYIIARLFRRLPQSDQRSLIDLVETLPGASTT